MFLYNLGSLFCRISAEHYCIVVEVERGVEHRQAVQQIVGGGARHNFGKSESAVPDLDEGEASGYETPYCGIIFGSRAQERRCEFRPGAVFGGNRFGQAHLSFLTLEVRAGNGPAIQLYLKHGFEQVGRRKNYYQRPREDAILMTREFAHGTEDRHTGTAETDL